MKLLHNHKIMNLFPLGLILIVMSAFSCTPKYAIERSIKAQDRLDTTVLSGAALIRTQFADIYAEHIDEKKWETLLKFKPFDNGGIGYRIPNSNFFLITIKSQWPKPLKIEEVTLICGNETKKSLPTEYLEKEFKSEQYRKFNFKKIFSRWRLASEPSSIDSLTLEKDAVEFQHDFIAPEDTILSIHSFGWISSDIDKFKLRIKIAIEGGKKVIDFDFARFEYRTEGKHFRNREEGIKDRIYEYR